MFSRFYPAEMAESSYDIDYEELYRQGYRGLIYDIDNTLVEHGNDANEQVIALFRRLNKIGFRICLLSNNQAPRVRRFYRGVSIKGVKLHYIFNAHKPSRKNYRRAMLVMGTTKKNTLFIGDQLFTDVYGANRTGIRSFLVKPINKREEIQIVLKRPLEKAVLFFYRKNRLRKLKNTNIVLIGFMGSGKEAVGKKLAEKFGYEFIDTDRLIEERLGMTIPEIVRSKGEEYFRDLETIVLKELVFKGKQNVISTGGGMPLARKNQKRLRKLGYVICLGIEPENAAERIKDEPYRELLPADEKQLVRMVTERMFIYRMIAHRVIMTDGLSTDEIVGEAERCL
ncbi:MAG: YqeG family HAD IIIA-type phosphatase [Lachnospiraceae bacterium]|nr:YqeG family HAD IIIA-type phosphatase [Lachnospiraceae bacterium]